MTYEVVLDALGDPTRRLIFDRLAPGLVRSLPWPPGLPVSRPAVSQHLKILKEAGLVTDEAVGARRLYRAASGGLLAFCGPGWTVSGTDFRAAYQAEIQRQMDERKNT